MKIQLLMGLAVLMATPARAQVPVYVFTASVEGLVDSETLGLRDSVLDVQKVIRKHAKKELVLVEDRAVAVLLIEVLARGYGNTGTTRTEVDALGPDARSEPVQRPFLRYRITGPGGYSRDASAGPWEDTIMWGALAVAAVDAAQTLVKQNPAMNAHKGKAH